MRNSKGQFIKGEKNGYENNLLSGHGWNKGTKGITKSNSGSFKKGISISPKTQFKKGQNPWNKDKKNCFSEESIKRMKEHKKGKCIGKNHWNWIEDRSLLKVPIEKRIRQSLEYQLWRKTCFERDNFTDQKTGISGGRLVVHHINNFIDFPELRFDINNGITLSEKSHIEFHKIYGKRNNTRSQLEEFLTASQED